MYAIVEIAGQQFKVEKGQKICVYRQAVPEGETVEFDRVLLVEDGDKVTVGEPVVKNMIVEGKILDNTVRGDKVIVFKKKRRKGYRVKTGHRQDYTQIEILDIRNKKAEKKAAEKKEENKAEAPVAEVPVEGEAKKPVKKAAPKKVAAAEGAEKPAVKKTVAKKPAAKTATEKKSDKE